MVFVAGGPNEFLEEQSLPDCLSPPQPEEHTSPFHLWSAVHDALTHSGIESKKS